MADTATASGASHTADEDFRRPFGSRVTKLREDRGWKQRELARRAQIDPGRLSKLERGIVRVSLEELIRLSVALDASLDELVFGVLRSVEGDWQRLLQELKRAGGPEAIQFTRRLFQALVLTFRTGERQEVSDGRR